MLDRNQPSYSLTLQKMKEKAGDKFDINEVNLAELQRLTGISRKKLRKLETDGFIVKPHGLTGRKKEHTVLSGFTGMIDALLMKGVTNSGTIKDQLDEAGYTGSQTTIKDYISKHKDLVPAKRQIVAPQGNRGRRYEVTGTGSHSELSVMPRTQSPGRYLPGLVMQVGWC